MRLPQGGYGAKMRFAQNVTERAYESVNFLQIMRHEITITSGHYGLK